MFHLRENTNHDRSVTYTIKTLPRRPVLPPFFLLSLVLTTTHTVHPSYYPSEPLSPLIVLPITSLCIRERSTLSGVKLRV